MNPCPATSLRRSLCASWTQRLLPVLLAFYWTWVMSDWKASGAVMRPVIKGDWWRIASNPDLGELTGTNQQPVDFAIWQASDSSWQLWSCIRNTKEKGVARLLHRWESTSLTNHHWKPMGIAMRADEKFGERPGGLQAPYVFKDKGRFVMLYGSWDEICSAASNDGRRFERVLDSKGLAELFAEPGGKNPRDPMVIRTAGLWRCYYTDHPDDKGMVYCRTSRDLRAWSASTVVARGGRAGTGPYSAECPFVVELEKGHFYLFRTQRYGADAQTSVYHSPDPMNFGVDSDEGYFVCTIPVAAPEIFQHEGEWFIAALLPSLKGIQVSRMAWEPARQE